MRRTTPDGTRTKEEKTETQKYYFINSLHVLQRKLQHDFSLNILQTGILMKAQHNYLFIVYNLLPVTMKYFLGTTYIAMRLVCSNHQPHISVLYAAKGLNSVHVARSFNITALFIYSILESLKNIEALL